MVHGIQGDRVEVFCKTSNQRQPKTFFDFVCDHLVECKIFPGVTTRAEMEERLFSHYEQRANIGVEFMNTERLKFPASRAHSFNFSFGQVKAQQWHEDMSGPNIQAVMAGSDGVRATEAARFRNGPDLDSVDKIGRYAHGGHLLSSKILQLFRENADVVNLIGRFGNLLRLNGDQDPQLEYTPFTIMRRGDVMCMRGGTMHRGPASNIHRFAWFCEYCPKTKPATPHYNRDDQDTPATLACTFWNLIWDDCSEHDHQVMSSFCTPFVINALDASDHTFRVSNHFTKNTDIHKMIMSIETAYFIMANKAPKKTNLRGLDSQMKVDLFKKTNYTSLNEVYDHWFGLNDAPFCLCYLDEHVEADRNVRNRVLIVKNILSDYRNGSLTMRIIMTITSNSGRYCFPYFSRGTLVFLKAGSRMHGCIRQQTMTRSFS